MRTRNGRVPRGTQAHTYVHTIISHSSLLIAIQLLSNQCSLCFWENNLNVRSNIGQYRKIYQCLNRTILVYIRSSSIGCQFYTRRCQAEYRAISHNYQAVMHSPMSDDNGQYRTLLLYRDNIRRYCIKVLYQGTVTRYCKQHVLLRSFVATKKEGFTK